MLGFIVFLLVISTMSGGLFGYRRYRYYHRPWGFGPRMFGGFGPFGMGPGPRGPMGGPFGMGGPGMHGPGFGHRPGGMFGPRGHRGPMGPWLW